MNNNEFKPTVAVSPGKIIKYHISHSNITGNELAKKLNISIKYLNKILDGESSITYELSLKLSEIIGGNPEFLMNLENNYQSTREQQRNLVYPAIYKHFKHSSDNTIPNNYMYVVIGVSKPLSLKDFPDDIYKRDKYLPMSIHNTEIDDEGAIYYINNQWYHAQDWCSEKLVLYKSLYDNYITYARPIDMFLSKVDRKKYPNINQEYRFELVRY